MDVHPTKNVSIGIDPYPYTPHIYPIYLHPCASANEDAAVSFDEVTAVAVSWRRRWAFRFVMVVPPIAIENDH